MEQFDPPLKLIESDKIELSADGKSFTFLSVTMFSDSIFIHPIPKQCFDRIEVAIEEAIEHEHLHLALQHIDFTASHALDNISPSIGNWNILLKKLEAKKRKV